MPELLVVYLAADRLGVTLGIIAIATVFGVVKHRERLHPAKESTDA